MNQSHISEVTLSLLLGFGQREVLLFQDEDKRVQRVVFGFYKDAICMCSKQKSYTSLFLCFF